MANLKSQRNPFPPANVKGLSALELWWAFKGCMRPMHFPDRWGIIGKKSIHDKSSANDINKIQNVVHLSAFVCETFAGRTLPPIHGECQYENVTELILY